MDSSWKFQSDFPYLKTARFYKYLYETFQRACTKHRKILTAFAPTATVLLHRDRESINEIYYLFPAIPIEYEREIRCSYN